jgi:hypothetical protein
MKSLQYGVPEVLPEAGLGTRTVVIVAVNPTFRATA